MFERRTSPRARTRLPGAVCLLEGTLACVITGLSRTGATLELPRHTEVARRFELRIGQEPRSRPVRKIWQDGTHVGVSFVEKRDAPEVLND
ncbi:hypothetical protein M446_2832 [Methylobacterium sp. 4-46]|uniref:PilZ domain-containing protein n=1 Tax=unclassified Methylobacterium TaxID=2615210 RepID=UPI000152D81A|nr:MULTISPECIES: PilZ domain-containing protein [Methylobacterium]ACA17257.1 hypothetical protein M446_2832 [Methylobacterium sp. 4-46]WFT82943.1 PilZ domain-containing protein [Methylobacterium nodulans]